MKQTLLFLIVMTSILTGCAPAYSDDAPSEVIITDNALTNDQLRGTWQGEFCSVDGAFSYQTDVEFSTSGNMIMVSSLYDNPSCSGPVAAVVTRDGSYWLGNVDSFVADTTDTDLNLNPLIYVSPANSLVAANFNLAHLCGWSAWQFGTTEALAPSSTCLPSMRFLPNGYTLVGISGSRLYFGNAGNTDIDGSSPYRFVGLNTPDLP